MAEQFNVRIFTAMLLMAVLTGAPSVAAQQSPSPEPPEHVIINFILPINPDTTNLLLSVVSAQMRNRAKKITIVLASPGGDPSSAFAAYNILKSLPIEITTFNAGNIDSAAMLIYCAGKHRYSLPSPARFLIHSAALNPIQTNYPVEYGFLDSQLAQLKSINQVIAQVILDNSNKKQSEIDAAIRNQTILSPEQAKEWGIVQEVRSTFMEPGAVFVSINSPPTQNGNKTPSSPYTTEREITSGNVSKQ